MMPKTLKSTHGSVHDLPRCAAALLIFSALVASASCKRGDPFSDVVLAGSVQEEPDSDITRTVCGDVTVQCVDGGSNAISLPDVAGLPAYFALDESGVLEFYVAIPEVPAGTPQEQREALVHVNLSDLIEATSDDQIDDALGQSPRFNAPATVFRQAQLLAIDARADSRAGSPAEQFEQVMGLGLLHFLDALCTDSPGNSICGAVARNDRGTTSKIASQLLTARAPSATTACRLGENVKACRNVIGKGARLGGKVLSKGIILAEPVFVGLNCKWYGAKRGCWLSLAEVTSLGVFGFHPETWVDGPEDAEVSLFMGICQDPYYSDGVWCEYSVFRNKRNGETCVVSDFKYTDFAKFQFECSKKHNGDLTKACPDCSEYDDCDFNASAGSGAFDEWELLPKFKEVKHGFRTVFTGMVKPGSCSHCPCNEEAGGEGDKECKDRLGEDFYCRDDGLCAECNVDNDCKPAGKFKCEYGQCKCKRYAKVHTCYYNPYWHSSGKESPYQVVVGRCLAGSFSPIRGVIEKGYRAVQPGPSLRVRRRDRYCKLRRWLWRGRRSTKGVPANCIDIQWCDALPGYVYVPRPVQI